MSKATFLKLNKTVSTKLEFAKSVANIYVCFNSIRLSDTQLTILSYFMVYGINPQTKELIVKSGACKNLANIKTIMVALKKLGLIYRDDLNNKVYLNKNLNFELTPTIGLFLKIDNK